MQDRKFPEGTLPVAACFLSAILLAILMVVLLVRGCARVPKPVNLTPTRASSSSVATSSTSASGNQWGKITIRPIRTHSGKSASAVDQQGALAKGAGVIGYGNPAIAKEEPSEGYEEITIEMGLTMAASASSGASASDIVASNQVEKQEVLPIGVILSTAPGNVALDYKLIGIGPVGLDVEGNHRQVGAGLSVGTKAFGTGGVYLGLDGGRGVYVGAGCRF